MVKKRRQIKSQTALSHPVFNSFPISRIDVFDPYSAEIIERNFSRIAGIKFQASTLHNSHLMGLLAQLDVDFITKGTLRRIGSKVRMRIYLYRTKDGAEIWIQAKRSKRR